LHPPTQALREAAENGDGDLIANLARMLTEPKRPER
jgi:hypothetical protein